MIPVMIKLNSFEITRFLYEQLKVGYLLSNTERPHVK